MMLKLFTNSIVTTCGLNVVAVVFLSSCAQPVESGPQSDCVDVYGVETCKVVEVDSAGGFTVYYLVDGIQEGVENDYGKDSTKRYEMEYENGEANGKIIYFYPDGKVRQEGFYKNGVKTGMWTEYYPNGNKEMKYSYDMDNLTEGQVWEWYENGVLKMTYTNRRGITEGPINYYYEGSEKLKAVIHVSGGIKHGMEYHFNEKGDTTTIVKWDNGEHQILKK